MPEKIRRPVVSFFHRKPRSVGNYSIEFIFDDVRKRLSDKIDPRIVYSPYESSGLIKRFKNGLHAFRKQSGVNHVTGDINYLGVFLSSKKTIQTILDCVHLETTRGLKHAILKYFWVTLPVKRAAMVTAISESTKQEILKYVQCPPEKIKVIYVAISDRFKKSPRSFNRSLPRILQIGTAPNKNIPRLIAALKGIDCVLEIIGKPNAEYETILKQNGIDYEYKWNLDDTEMIERYKAADIVSLVSTYEGFGMPILEAQAIGRPVITANVFSMPEVAGDAACIVDPYDVTSIREGLLRIINDDSYREGLIEKGYQNVLRFDPDKIAEKYFELYRQVNEKQQ